MQNDHVIPPPDVNLNVREPPETNEEEDNHIITNPIENESENEDYDSNEDNEDVDDSDSNNEENDINSALSINGTSTNSMLLENEENNTESSLASSFEFCHSKPPKFDNCLFTQVTPNLTDYGCSLCKKDYYLSAGSTGSGICKAKNPIKHCIATQTFPSFQKNKVHCWSCEKDYILSHDLKNCNKKIKSHQKILHCDHYFRNSTSSKDILCNACEDGYTLSSDMKKCTKGCDLQNCAKCQLLEDAPFCFMCKKNYIGILSQSVFLFTDCMSLNDIRKLHC